MFAEIVSFICTSLFAGAALYVSVVEHPARLACSTDVALAEWRPSYKRAAIMQVILAAGGVLAWTLIVIMPTNKELLNPTRVATTPDTDVLLRKWGRLHVIRTVASLLAAVILAANIIGYL